MPNNLNATTSQQTGTGASQRPRTKSIRAATSADIDLIHLRLMEVIKTSPYYCDEFKNYEMARLSKTYLANLIAIDPFHVMICLDKQETAGFMITGPEFGTLWLYWSYMFPEKRRATLAMVCLKEMISHWDNTRFHKISTYLRPENNAVALMKRFKFSHTCTLENHIFGQDYLLYEFPLNKVVPGYDNGVSIGRMARLKGKLRSIFRI